MRSYNILITSKEAAMNFLPIIILLFLFTKKRGSNPMEMLGLINNLKDNPIVTSLFKSGENPVQKFMNGEFSAENIMQLVSLAGSLSGGSAKSEETKPPEDDSAGMTPIENIANDEISGSLERYLNNAD